MCKVFFLLPYLILGYPGGSYLVTSLACSFGVFLLPKSNLKENRKSPGFVVFLLPKSKLKNRNRNRGYGMCGFLVCVSPCVNKCPYKSFASMAFERSKLQGLEGTFHILLNDHSISPFLHQVMLF